MDLGTITYAPVNAAQDTAVGWIAAGGGMAAKFEPNPGVLEGKNKFIGGTRDSQLRLVGYQGSYKLLRERAENFRRIPEIYDMWKSTLAENGLN